MLARSGPPAVLWNLYACGGAASATRVLGRAHQNSVGQNRKPSTSGRMTRRLQLRLEAVQVSSEAALCRLPRACD